MHLFRLNQKDNMVEFGHVVKHGYEVKKIPVSSLDKKNGLIRLGKRAYYDGLKVCEYESMYRIKQERLINDCYNRYKNGIYVLEKLHDL